MIKYKAKISKRLGRFTVLREIVFGLFKKSEMCGDILIVGDRGFIDGTISILNFLKDKDIKTYELVDKFIDSISLKDKFPYININVATRICFVGKEIAYSPKESYASLLAQQAFYIYLYEEIKKKNPKLKHIPEDLWCKGPGKIKALEFRKNVLINLGASEELLECVDSEIERLQEDKQPPFLT